MSNQDTPEEQPAAARQQVRMSDTEAVALAVDLHKFGRIAEADGIYRRILEAIPDHVDALHFHGLLLFQQGQRAAGIQAVRRAVELQPDYVEAHNNLGNMLKETGDDEGALQAYRRVLELRPDHADTHNNLGVMLRKRGQLAQALQSYQEATRLEPRHADAWHNLGNLYQTIHRWDEAMAAYRRAAAYRPTRDATYVELGRVCYRAGRIEDAARIYREWLQRDPANPIAQHLVAACSGESGPSRASDDYIRRTFDTFADNFDQVLTQLDYHVPGLIAQLLEQGDLGLERAVDILDAGCGTGLCGVSLRPYARRLVGVDLSPLMLSRARERGVYDELFEAELTGYLGCHPGQFDLIVSGDTLVYFGDLGPVLSAARAALQPGGRCLFTVERETAAESCSGFRIQPHGRYCHTESYVRQALTAAGLELNWLRNCVLRQELGEPVAGMLVLAQC